VCSERSGRVAGVVLAAGSSSRMGRNKLLFDLNGEPLVRRAVRTAVDAGLDPVIVVLGHEADAVRAALEGLPCRDVVNPVHTEGMNSSVCAGITAVPSEAAAAIVLLADMPFVSAAMIGTLLERFRAGDALLVVSAYGGVNAPPTLYDRALFAELAGVEGRGCGKRMLRRHPGEATIVHWPATAIADLDVPDDYARVKAQLEAQ